jgi:glycosyltransferase involved in cell wall biosynthesis
MKISIVISTYNSEKYISRAIRSCLDQSMDKKEYEIIVVDDGSTDNTNYILKSFGDWIRIITLDKNYGLPYACNVGIRAAMSRFVVRVDADDFINEDLLKVEYLFLSMNTDFDAVACDYFITDENENFIERKNSEMEPIACGILFRKDKLIEIGLYDESFKLLEDEDLRIRYLKKFNIKRIALPLYRYRMHTTNITKQKEKMEFYKSKLNEKHSEMTNNS